jgi:hypothetical protein
VAAGHVGLGPGLVDEDQAARIKLTLRSSHKVWWESRLLGTISRMRVLPPRARVLLSLCGPLTSDRSTVAALANEDIPAFFLQLICRLDISATAIHRIHASPMIISGGSQHTNKNIPATCTLLSIRLPRRYGRL